MAKVQFLTGTGRSGREAAIDAYLITHLPHARLLVPTVQYARRRTENIVRNLNMPGLWERPIQTFQTFVDSVLKASRVDVQPVSVAEQRLLLEQVVAELAAAGKLDAIGAAAETEGFISHMLRVIRQLKQGAVEPADFRKKVLSRNHPSELDAVVADVYEAYQTALVEARVYDQEGLYWEASILFDKGEPVPGLKGVDALLLDGFDEFTPAQFRLIQKIEPHVDWLIFGIAYDAGHSSAADLYSVPIRTLGLLEKAFDYGIIDHAEEEPISTISQFAAREIFWRDEPKLPAGLDENVRVMPCTTAVQEVESIARRIKTLILDHGVAPDDVAVVYRGLADVQDTLRTVFAECGIPVRVGEGMSLDRTSIGAFILAMFDAWAAWDREAVTDVLRAPWLHGGAPDTSRVVDAVCRAAGIIRGRHEWQTRLAALQSRIAAGKGALRDEDGELRERTPLGPVADPVGACALVEAGRAKLAEFEAKVGDEGRQNQFAENLLSVVEALNLEQALAAMPETVRVREEPALEALYRLLDGAEESLGAAAAEAIPRDEFVRRLRQAMCDTNVRAKQPRRGVHCLSAEAVRHMKYRHVFFAALNEGIVPQRPALNAVYSDEDFRDLVEAGINLERQQFRTDYEMLLFHRVLESATDTLWLSYRTLGPEGKALLPSPYLSDLLTLAEGHVDVEDPPSVHDAATEPGLVASWRDVRNTAFRLGERAVHAFGGRFVQQLHGAAIESQRFRSVPCDRFDGVLADDALLDAIKKRFGPDHVFSVSRLEAYLSCPFRFFLEHLLKAEEPEALEEEFDPMVRGAAYHEVLERFHRSIEGQPIATLDQDELIEAANQLERLCVEVIERRAGELDHLPKSLIRLEVMRATAVMQRYLHIESGREKDAHWEPRHFEVSFGFSKYRSDDPLFCEDAYELETPAGPVAFAGKIDRIDRHGNSVRLIDYKTSVYITNRDVVEGRSIQLGVYALAYEQLIDMDSGVDSAWFMQIGRSNRLEALHRHDKKSPWEERQKILRDAVAEAVTGIREGRFHPVLGDGACVGCASRKACRHDAARMLRKAECMAPQDEAAEEPA